MKFIREFNNYFNPINATVHKHEIISEEDIYLILADFIEEEDCDITINVWFNGTVCDIGLKVDRNDLDKSEEIYQDIIDRLISHGFYLATDPYESRYGSTGKFKDICFFGPEKDNVKISMTKSEDRINMMMSGCPSLFRLKNKDKINENLIEPLPKSDTVLEIESIRNKLKEISYIVEDEKLLYYLTFTSTRNRVAVYYLEIIPVYRNWSSKKEIDNILNSEYFDEFMDRVEDILLSHKLYISRFANGYCYGNTSKISFPIFKTNI